ncbi:alpha/beta hydrolase [Sphingomonas sp. G-3-2-10]|uniref:alpha/beta fold hydrolase n=1 Tax=Sphingomonas sp. G-3-2-10 TaxID=2728838 RepID=UPI00146BFE01|nr:alpha/beta hydrolase [Sphingomonas sp. G-3-2-10]NML06060.1 alpha/beta hydrolase [Sphingomonas sp. G-3-2-10]
MSVSPYDRRAIPLGANIHRWSAPDGWELRAFAWPAATATPRGSILFQGGRGDIFEKYLEVFHHWHDQGWTITSFDWRGQGGSGRLTEAANCGHIENFGQFVSDLRAFYAQWVSATPGPHVAMGHSMGGHILLRALTEGVVAPDAAVLIAPMLGVKGPLGQAMGERLAKLMGGVGDSSRPAWKGNEKPYTTETRANLLTHDRARYEDELFWQQTNPGNVTGPPSWRWVIEAFKSMRELRNSPRLKTMKVPVLMLIADADGLVEPRSALQIAPKLPDARVVRFGKEAAHEVLREVDAVRNRAIGEIDLFLAARAQKS